MKTSMRNMERNKFKLTLKMKKELEVIRFFIQSNLPKKYNNCSTKELSEQAYFLKTTQGKEQEMTPKVKYEFNRLMQGVRWRGIHIHELYEKGILDGDVPYYVLLDGLPFSVAEFISKEMFKGTNKKLILRIWQDLNVTKTHSDLNVLNELK